MIEFGSNNILHWGKFYLGKDVKIEWHGKSWLLSTGTILIASDPVPSAEEIDFVVELLDRLVSPFLEKIEGLLENSSNWDNISRNDFCRYVIFLKIMININEINHLQRYLYAVRSYWGGLSTFIQEYDDVKDPLAEDETGKAAGLEPYGLALKAGFTLTDPNDPNYRHIYEQKQRYGNVMHRAATVLQGNNGGEDHIDAVVALLKVIVLDFTGQNLY